MYVILYVRSIVFIINAAFLYINWARLIVLYPVIYYLLEIKEPSYISQTLYVCYASLVAITYTPPYVTCALDASSNSKVLLGANDFI